MIKIKTIGIWGFEGTLMEDTYEALRNLFCDIGVIKRGGIRKPLRYSAIISENNKNVKLGEFNTDKEAHEAIIKHQVERFINNASQFTDTMQIYPCVDKGYFVTPTGLVITRFGTKVKGGLSTTGYLRTNIWVNGTHKFRSFHRMIAESLIPNPDNLPCINHIDGNKQNNNVTNLEWVTYSENTIHAMKIGLKTDPKGRNHYKRAVNQYTLDGKFIRRWESIKAVQDKWNLKSIKISSCCRGRIKTSLGYKWEYAD